ncbi:thioredoxin family protein [Streptomyces phaeochromogenes]|uniref:glutaredoxin family protein n=1 Tax=Streptomyces phaeochromogenes TaxID=1923 RepID=UPI002E298087|nr:thioredoxin family protein [Streptomyces phaeochromogenes]
MIALTLLTQADCAWCDRAKQLLAETDADVEVTEASLDTDEECELAARHRLLFAPGLFHDDRLIAYGRVSARALRRELNRLPQT